MPYALKIICALSAKTAFCACLHAYMSYRICVRAHKKYVYNTPFKFVCAFKHIGRGASVYGGGVQHMCRIKNIDLIYFFCKSIRSI